MAEFFSQMRSRISEFLGGGAEPEEMQHAEQEYVELDTSSPTEHKGKIIVRPFVIDTFESIKGVLDALREGSTIALVNIKPLKEKDVIELKRAINKLKKTTDAISGDIAGFGDDYIVATPSFARIHRYKDAAPAQQVETQTQTPEQEMM
ncbi:cell division protein SepF [Candidatus Woesearchaeota archaeon]|nr:cell division protein SepF [Candidatus Woesearchaeota archaeon]